MQVIFLIVISMFLVEGCPPRYYDKNDDCLDCISGFYCPGDNKIYECVDGFYSLHEEKECFKCGCKNTDTCPKGNIINNKTGEIIKYAGYCDGEEPCIPGYGYDKEKKSCLKCNKGYYSPGGNKQCQRCDKNTIINDSQDGCIECPIGEQSIAGGQCRACRPGTYYDNNMYKCILCPEHYYTDDYRQLECKKCPDGMYSNERFNGCSETRPHRETDSIPKYFEEIFTIRKPYLNKDKIGEVLK